MSKKFFDSQNIPEEYGKFLRDSFKILSPIYIQLLLISTPLIIIKFLNALNLTDLCHEEAKVCLVRTKTSCSD